MKLSGLLTGLLLTLFLCLQTLALSIQVSSEHGASVQTRPLELGVGV